MTKTFSNNDRSRYYGLRIGDIVDLKGVDGKVCQPNAEVIEYGSDNNRVEVRLMSGSTCDWVAEWCDIVVRVEDRACSATKNLDLKNGDFRKYYDTEQKRNIWVLGYFGGGAVNIMEAYRLACEYSDECKVPIGTVKIDEVLSSRRFKGFKYLYSNVEQENCGATHVMNDVHKWLRD
jgi:hypothetical protein